MILPIDTDIFPQKKGVYIVGGSIRDIIYGRRPIDYDLAVKSDPLLFAKGLAARTSGRIVELGKNEQIMRRIVTKDCFFDVLPIYGDSIEDDLHRRDFTINAMAVDVASGDLIDPTGGGPDMDAKKIRMVSGSVFQRDPVRLIRAYRLAAILGFSIHADTQIAIARDAHLIHSSAGERIREEMFKILRSAESHPYLSQMAHSELLFSIFPELESIKGYRSTRDAPLSLFDQTMAAYRYFEELLNSKDQPLSKTLHRLLKGNDNSLRGLLKLALLLHDIGKNPTIDPALEGRTHDARRHAAVSADMAGSICRRLKFSRSQSDYLDTILRNHYRPFVLFGDWKRSAVIHKKFTRFFMKCADVTPDILTLALADIMIKKRSEDPATREFYQFVLELIREYDTVLKPRSSLPPPLNGNDLINEFGLKPSARFKRILMYVEEEHLLRHKFTRKQAIELVAELLKRKGPDIG